MMQDAFLRRVERLKPCSLSKRIFICSLVWRSGEERGFALHAVWSQGVLSVQGVFYNLMLQDASIELLTKLEYFISAFTSHGCKSSKATLGCSCSSLNCICVGCSSFVLITVGGS